MFSNPAVRHDPNHPWDQSPSPPVPRDPLTLLHIIFRCSKQGCARISHQGVRDGTLFQHLARQQASRERAFEEMLMAIQISKVPCPRRTLGDGMKVTRVRPWPSDRHMAIGVHHGQGQQGTTFQRHIWLGEGR